MTGGVRFGAAALILFAAACAGPAPDQTGNQAPPPPQSAGSAATAPAPPPDPAPRAAPSTPVATAALPAAPEPPVNDDPNQFLAQAPDLIAAALGNPALIRRDGPAEVWQYKGRGCVLDLFLYKTDGGGFATRHVELRGTGLSDSKRRDCLADMLRDQARRSG